MTPQKKTNLVSREMAGLLLDAGFPQEMRVGDWGIHPHAKTLVRCSMARRKTDSAAPVDDPVVRVPTVEEATEFMRANNLVEQPIPNHMTV